MLKGAAGFETPVIPRLPVPLLETVMLRSDVVPMRMFPKVSADVDTLIFGTTAPVLNRLTVTDGVSGSFEFMTNDDCLKPALVGLNEMVIVQLAEALIAPMQLLLDMIKSPAGFVRLVILRTPVPLFVTVTFWLVVEPTRIFGKITGFGLALIFGADAPVPLRFTVKLGTHGSFDAITKLEFETTALVGAKRTVN